MSRSGPFERCQGARDIAGTKEGCQHVAGKYIVDGGVVQVEADAAFGAGNNQHKGKASTAGIGKMRQSRDRKLFEK